MFKPLRIYIETSVWNFLDASDAIEKQEITKLFFESAKKHSAVLYTSDVTLVEISKAPALRRQWLENVVKKFSPEILEVNEGALDLADKYISAHLVPRKYRDDALHLAIAACYELDVLVSWNMKHLVKLSTRRGTSAINKLHGYREIEICTPEEVF